MQGTQPEANVLVLAVVGQLAFHVLPERGKHLKSPIVASAINEMRIQAESQGMRPRRSLRLQSILTILS